MDVWCPPAYAGAAFVAYSRVYADKHYVEDVLAGAAIGIIASEIFTTPRDNVSISPIMQKDTYVSLFGKDSKRASFSDPETEAADLTFATGTFYASSYTQVAVKNFNDLGSFACQ